MRLMPVICAGLVLIAGTCGSASAIGLTVDRLDNPNAVECPQCHRAIVAGSIRESAETTLATEFGGSLAEKGIAHNQERGRSRRLDILVYRYQERQGGNFSVERAASVGFHAHFYEGDNLARVFVFDETQQPLSENVLRFFTFVRRGAKWITAAELAREGVQKAVDALGDALREGGQGR
jgi:hypothetical protein